MPMSPQEISKRYKRQSLGMPDAGRMITQLGTPRGRYDEHSSKFSLTKKPRFVDPVGKSQT
jgi:hypothetical protein